MKSRIIIAVHNGKCVIYWCLDSLALDGFYLIHLLYCKIQTTLSFIIFEVTTTYFETTINGKSVHKYDDSPRYKYKLSIWTIGPHSNDDDEWYNCQKCVRSWKKGRNDKWLPRVSCNKSALFFIFSNYSTSATLLRSTHFLVSTFCGF